MNNNAAQSLANLTVAFNRLETAIKECDRLRRPPAAKTVLTKIAEEMCSDGEMFDMDYLIKQMDSMTRLASVRARQLEWITEKIQGEAKP